jgi:hypothetical protein
MRLRIATMAGVILFALTRPAAALDSNTGLFVAGMTLIYVTAEYCDEFELVENGIARAADRNGIDQSIVRATANALLAQMDRPYDPKYLIPEITVLVRDTIVALKRTLAKNKSGNCKDYGDNGVEAGMLRRKNGRR